MTVEEIRQIAQLSHPKKMREETRNYPYIGRVIRRVSPYFAKFFIDANISANKVSLISIFFGILGGLVFAFGNYYLMILGCIVFLHLWNLFDCVDGEVARVTKDLSLGGSYLEDIHNPIIDSIFMACFGIGLFKLQGDMLFLYLGLVFALTICLVHNFNRSRYYIRKTVKAEAYKFPLRQKKSLPGRVYRSLYGRISLLFLLPNAYLILTGVILFELFSPVKLSYELYGVSFNLLASYFLLYGIDWLARTVISGLNGYRYLMRLNHRVNVSQSEPKN